MIEAVPAPVTDLLIERLNCLTIGIGAGGSTDGQVLVWHDLLGISDGHLARFVRRFADLRSEMVRGVAAYSRAVREGSFPASEHTYGIGVEELEALVERLNMAR